MACSKFQEPTLDEFRTSKKLVLYRPIIPKMKHLRHILLSSLEYDAAIRIRYNSIRLRGSVVSKILRQFDCAQDRVSTWRLNTIIGQLVRFPTPFNQLVVD